MLAWDVAYSEDPGIAENLVNRACLRERISKQRKQPLVLHANNGKALAKGLTKDCVQPR